MKTVLLWCVLISLTSFSFLRADDQPTTRPADKQLLQGTWVTVKKMKNGSEEAVTKDASLITFAGEQVFSTADGKDSGSGRFTVDETTTPRRITLSATTGPLAGKTFSAIYQIDGNTLRLAFSTGDDNESRPKDFEGAAGEALIVLERQKV